MKSNRTVHVYRVGFSGHREGHPGGYRHARHIAVLADDLDHAMRKARMRIENDGYTNVQVWSANHIVAVDLYEDEEYTTP